ncbi:cation:dicarboxylate symporter family transporter [Streptomyces sp. TP-A0874]|uniref:cation:dicarboxylate symporter family transporter n=1 Tax=Streptomyces sp. TP-A0874 TaxID=549819 RepID=UPI000A48BEC4|nr:cation:dicarboxylase symporter family transporter [Streptomyces sp. TP-A0874]
MAVSREHVNRTLTFWVLLGLFSGAVFGLVAPGAAAHVRFLADGFISVMMTLIPPVIFTTVVGGVAALGSGRRMGRLSLKAIVYYEAMTTAALGLGLLAGNLLNFSPLETSGGKDSSAQLDSLLEKVERVFDSSAGVNAIAPQSLFSAITGGNPLHALTVGVLIGGAILMAGRRAAPVLDLVNRCSHILFCAVRILLVGAPLAAFGGAANTTSQHESMQDTGVLHLLFGFFGTCALAVFLGLGLLARLNGFSLLRLLRFLRYEILLVIGTSSSGPVFPRVLRKLELAGVPRATSAPLMAGGQSFHLIGTCVYITMGATYIGAAAGHPMGLGEQLFFLAIAAVVSKSAVGVTGSGLLTLIATISVAHSVPVSGVALLIGIDRFMSEARALTNLVGNAVATLVISKWAGQLDTERLREVLTGQRRVEPDRPADDPDVVDIRISDT